MKSIKLIIILTLFGFGLYSIASCTTSDNREPQKYSRPIIGSTNDTLPLVDTSNN